MNHLFASHPGLRKFVADYPDDILIRSSTRKKHMNHVQIVLHLLQKAGQKWKWSKYEWFCDEI
jgi:hypothetical protein